MKSNLPKTEVQSVVHGVNTIFHGVNTIFHDVNTIFHAVNYRLQLRTGNLSLHYYGLSSSLFPVLLSARTD